MSSEVRRIIMTRLVEDSGCISGCRRHVGECACLGQPFGDQLASAEEVGPGLEDHPD